MTKKPGQKLGEFLTLRLEEDLRAGLENLANEEQRTVGQLVRILLREGLDRRKGGKKTAGKISSRVRSTE